MRATTFAKRIFGLTLGLALTLTAFGQPTGYQADALGNIDSVTVGGASSYFVAPDAALNPSFIISSPALADLVSTFAWSETQGSGTIARNTSVYAAGAADVNWVEIDWATVGTGQVSVTESAAGCASGTPVVIDVAVIAAPTVNYPAAGGSEDICATGTDGSLSPPVSDVDVNFTTGVAGNRNMRLTYDISGPAGFSAVTDHEVAIDEANNDFTLAQTLTHYGVYTVTLKGATDRIAVKSGVTGLVGANTTFTINVLRTPVTGTMYHIPN
ncbi:MAG: hypothetical protein HC896_09695 [Bacteroidales bacterium]|nr:hypothetical protein [Bacteroidales bacterium]